MSEYTYSDVIIDPNDKRVKIGEKYFFYNNPTLAIESANSDNTESFKLTKVVSGTCPFVYDFKENMEGASCCIIKEKEKKSQVLLIKCTSFDLDNGEKYQIGYLPNEALPLITYSKNNNVVMCESDEPKIEHTHPDSSKKEEVKEYLCRKWLTNGIQEVEWFVNVLTLVDGKWYAEEYTGKEFLDNFTLISTGNGNMKLKRRRFPRHRTHK